MFGADDWVWADVPSPELEQLELVTAQRDAALDALHKLVKYTLHIGGYMEHEGQVELRVARAILAESGRTV